MRLLRKLHALLHQLDAEDKRRADEGHRAVKQHIEQKVRAAQEELTRSRESKE